ncbi:peptide chain release factor N(5)-glutamine methyltransferase [Zymobacter palmae]|uniref:peptide chain release factor N(5)-glutamine methyltransferase n=1 Tax=Zymobacter palmae TaxID=33074 RepID=UPI000483FE3E|nr:peptide chain release factor N(5)-glutamine methyltransferase [Zymobacter palmae]
MSADALLKAAAQTLSSSSDTARLDAELLLCHVIGKPRTWLYTWGDQTIAEEARAAFATLIERRHTGEPVAYLIGEREFWGLTLETAPHTLIPRPDTELVVDTALARATRAEGQLLDLGTGTGAIALAFASERAGWQVIGADVVPEAVSLAQRNARRLGIANARFIESNWFTALPPTARFELIVSNPPYIAADDHHLNEGDVRFEPRSALVADDDGLADLRHLVDTAWQFLRPEGWLLLEHGWTQAEAVCAMLNECGYVQVESLTDLGQQPRVSLGQKPMNHTV